MTGMIRGANRTLSKFLPEQTLVLRGRTGEQEITFSPLARLGLLVATVATVGWVLVATVATISIRFESDSAEARSIALQDAYEQRLAELSAERDDFARQAQATQARFNQALQQVALQQDDLIASMTVQNEQRITLFALQQKLNSAMAERNAAQQALDGLQAEFAKLAEGNGPRESSESELKYTLKAMNAILEDAVKTRDESLAYTEELQAQIEATAAKMRLDAQRRDRMITQVENATKAALGPLRQMFKSAGMDVDSVLNVIRQNYSGAGGPGNTELFPDDPAQMDKTELRLQKLLQDLDTVEMLNMAGNRIPMVMPVRASVRATSSFGVRHDPFNGSSRMHKGQDWAGPVGTPLYATADGVVKFAGRQHGYGNVVIIQHDFGFETFYAHQSKIRVVKGQRVSRGDRIGDMGSTGRSTGSHVHYEVRLNGKAVNPLTYIKAGRYVY